MNVEILTASSRLKILKKILKGTLSDLRKFLENARFLKIMKNGFYLKSKAFSFSRYLNFCCEFLLIGKQLAKKAEVNSNIYDITDWITNKSECTSLSISQELKAISH